MFLPFISRVILENVLNSVQWIIYDKPGKVNHSAQGSCENALRTSHCDCHHGVRTSEVGSWMCPLELEFLEALQMKAEFTQMFPRSCVVSGVPCATKQKRKKSMAPSLDSG